MDGVGGRDDCHRKVHRLETLKHGITRWGIWYNRVADTILTSSVQLHPSYRHQALKQRAVAGEGLYSREALNSFSMTVSYPKSLRKALSLCRATRCL